LKTILNKVQCKNINISKLNNLESNNKNINFSKKYLYNIYTKI